MNVRHGAWEVHLSSAAETDLAEILAYTAAQFGDGQARAYAQTLSSALQLLSSGPAAPGVRMRDEIFKGLCFLHVARRGRPGRHFVMFRIGRDSGPPTIEVLRVLHDAMDFGRHIAPP